MALKKKKTLIHQLNGHIFLIIQILLHSTLSPQQHNSECIISIYTGMFL